MPEIPVAPACRGRCKTEGVDREAQRRLCHPERFGAAPPAEGGGPRERYARQLLLPGFDEGVQARLRRATALVAGVGGLGGPAALYLTTAGIGRLILLHPGDLEWPDLNRQVLMEPVQVGRPRVVSAAAFLRRFNPEVTVVAVPEPVDEGRVSRWLGEADVVLDCRHNFPERHALNRACVRAGKPLVEAAMDAMAAHLTVVLPGRTPCLACLFPAPPPDWDPLGFPVLGAVPGSLGSMAALEAIKVITGWGRPLAGRMLVMDLGEAEFRILRVRRLPGCPVCGAVPGGAADGGGPGGSDREEGNR